MVNKEKQRLFRKPGDVLVAAENYIYIYIYIYILISKNDIYTKVYSMHEEHRANPENTRRRKQGKNIKENQTTE